MTLRDTSKKTLTLIQWDKRSWGNITVGETRYQLATAISAILNDELNDYELKMTDVEVELLKEVIDIFRDFKEQL